MRFSRVLFRDIGINSYLIKYNTKTIFFTKTS